MFSSVIWLTRVTVTGEGSTKISVQKCDPTWYGNCACGVMSDVGQEEVDLSWFLWFSLNMPILCGFCPFGCVLHTLQDSQVEQHLRFLYHSPCGNEIFFLLKPVAEDWPTYPGDHLFCRPLKMKRILTATGIRSDCCFAFVDLVLFSYFQPTWWKSQGKEWQVRCSSNTHANISPSWRRLSRQPRRPAASKNVFSHSCFSERSYRNSV